MSSKHFKLQSKDAILLGSRDSLKDGNDYFSEIKY